VLVTGGSRGIGAAACRLFARAGAAVAIGYRARRERAEEVLADCAALSGEPHLAVAADLADGDGVAALFARLGEAWGRLDHLVNNAGVWERNPIAELDPERYAATLRINLSGPFLCTREALPLLAASDAPSIVNVASTSGQRGESFYSPYSASKGALVAATKAWATELAPRVRVNAVALGWVDTEMCEEPFAGGGREEIAATIPLGRVAAPEDVAGPIVFLCSPLARHVTGAVLNVNGGSVLSG